MPTTIATTTHAVKFHGWTLPAGSVVTIERWSSFKLATATAFDNVNATTANGDRVALPTSALPIGCYLPETA